MSTAERLRPRKAFCGRAASAALLGLSIVAGCAEQPLSPEPDFVRPVAPLLSSVDAYGVTDLGTLGGTYSSAWGMDNFGRVVGEADLPNGGAVHAVLWEVGTVLDLGTLDGHVGSIARDINDDRQIVGISQNAEGQERAFLWEQGAMTDLGTLGGASSAAYGINSSGHVVGCAMTVSSTSYQPVLWVDGIAQALGSGRGCAYAISDTGLIVGQSDGEAFLWQDGTITFLGTLGGSFGSVALGVNDHGQVVGASHRPDGERSTFVWYAGAMVELAPPGYPAWEAWGITSDGQIAGSYHKSDEAPRWRTFVFLPSTPNSTTGSFIDLLSVVGGEASSWAINEAGQIAGYGRINNTWQAHLWTLPEANEAPAIVSITLPFDPVAVSTKTQITASFTDANPTDVHTASVDWGDGTPAASGAVAEADGAGIVTGQHTFSQPGVYVLTVVVSDGDMEASRSSLLDTPAYVVVYDPEAGFVTGGGWIDSPADAYAADPALTGKASFGFISRYENGATTPSGETQFQFRAGGLHFHSTAYEWLVISGPKAQYKGAGTIGGSGDYGFLLTVNDGEVSGGGGVDRFRVKIWDSATGEVVYDNQVGDSEDADASTALGGGSIVIHK